MKHKLMTSTIASLMFVAGAAVAADPTPVSVSGGTIHFEGKLVNAACAVSTKSADQTVTLGQYRTASFTAIDDTTAQVPFSIVLNDCDPKVAATAAVA
ncbi:type 1 fimbrial protein subunit FimA, partial [Salmonella enterica subsp. enterica]|nr:type 1 fimbrial protein subunit FimA [Salmonella enterica subsp. enterica serovar Rissen]